MSWPCNCCRGISVLTPLDLTNRPGLSALAYRIGTYASFFETMKARLSSTDFELASGALPLATLTTRDSSDPAIAWLDAWAIVADVLTFYQERIANEGYLRTAKERQSVMNLAALVDYILRPGVAASVYLAYTLDQNSQATIPAGSRVQSSPPPGALPQSFETSGDLEARGAWNNLAPRLTRPQIIQPDSSQIYVTGVSTNLKPNDPVLIVASPPHPRRVASVDIDFAQKRTKVELVPLPKKEQAHGKASTNPVATAESTLDRSFVSAVALVKSLSVPPAAHPASPIQLDRSARRTFRPEMDTTPALLKTFNPQLGAQLYAGLRTAQVTQSLAGELHALRVQAAPFGHNAPLRPITDENGALVGTEEWPLVSSLSVRISHSARAEAEITAGKWSLDSIRDRLTREGPTALVQVSDPEVSASAVVPVTDGETRKIGKWELQVKVGRDVGVMFSIAGHSYDIQFGKDTNSIDVTLDGTGPAIAIPLGESSVTAAPGRRTVISSIKGLLIDDEVAMAPAAKNILPLDMVYDQISQGSYVVIDRADTSEHVVAKVTQPPQKVSLTNYGMTARVTQLTLDTEWLHDTDLMLTVARNTTVSAQSEQLDLAEEPITDYVPVNQKEQASQIELGNLYDGLKSGRWLIVQGERADIDGVTAAELVMLDNVRQGVQQVSMGNTGATQDLPGDATHSFLQLSNALSYQYKRPTVTVYGNVVRATHGETRKEVLGSGDGAQELQQFSLHQGPLTYLPASNPCGVQSTLDVQVNGVSWTEVDSLASAGPNDRVYISRADASGKQNITFGTGRNGKRLPTGQANVIANYRMGLGSGGNADSGKVNLVATRPLGVKSVTNPISSSGGADGDTTDQGRKNTPAAVIALDRLVSVSDYADFARTYAGIGKSSSQLLSDGRQQVVFLTIAGAEGTVIDKSSGLYTNLVEAFQQLGDARQPVDVEICELMLLVISAEVKVLSGYNFVQVAPQIRAALLDAFSFDNQELATTIPLSRVISVIQNVSGVQYVKVQVLDSISESETQSSVAFNAKLTEIVTARSPRTMIYVPGAHLDPNTGKIYPASLAFLSPDFPDTLILTEAAL